MNGNLVRVGTTYIPVTNIDESVEWYVRNLKAELTYKDLDKAILNIANQSMFLVKAPEGQSANFIDAHGNERFSLTFEVNGLEALISLQEEFKQKGMKTGEIENRGHAGRNFIFYDCNGNKFDVWSELSPAFMAKGLQ